MGMGLNSLHYSLNDKNRDHLVEAKQKLDSLTPNIKAIVGDEIRMLMENDEAGIGVVWSGTAQELMWEKDNLEYVLPEEGSNLWFDNMVIPKTAKNPEAAHQFMNFILDPENAAQNTEYVGYSTPNKEALKYMDEETISDERFYPDEEMTARLEVYENLGKRMLAYYNELFLEFKMHKNKVLPGSIPGSFCIGTVLKNQGMLAQRRMENENIHQYIFIDFFIRKYREFHKCCPAKT